MTSEPRASAPLTKRQRRQATKADMLDALHQTVLNWDPLTDSHGLSVEEYQGVQTELGRQLYAWAVRITPAGAVDDSSAEGMPE